MMIRNERQFSDLIGKTLVKIEGLAVGSDYVRFFTDDGQVYLMFHEQDCCESVRIEDVCGDVNDLIGIPICRASADSSGDNPPGVDTGHLYQDESYTWTFYNIATFNGHITIRWYGASNGYYSEGVSFYLQPNPTEQ